MKKEMKKKHEDQKLRNKLKKIAYDNERTDLVWYVAEDILESAEDYDTLESRFRDILNNGGQSGTITGLLYTKECQDWYDKYYDDIEELIKEIEEKTGEKVEVYNKSGIDRKNFYAWLAYEEVTRQLADELGIEI